MANHNDRDTGSDEAYSTSADPADGTVADALRFPELNAVTGRERIIVAGDGYADELDDTGEFPPLEVAAVGAATEPVQQPSGTTADSTPTAPPGTPVPVVVPAPPNERAAFWLKHLESEIERVQHRWEQIANELNSRETRIEQLLAAAREQESTIDGLREQLDSRVAAVANLQTELQTVEARNRDLMAGQAERDATIAQRDRDLDETRNRIAVQQSELAAAAVKRDELLAALEQSRSETAEAAQRHRSELAASDELRVKIQELEAYIDGRSSSWSAQNTKIAEYRNELAAIRISAAATEASLLARTAEYQRLGAKLADVERDAGALAARHQESQNRNAELEMRMTEEATVTAAVRTDLVAAQRSRQDTAAELAQREELVTSLERGVLRRDQNIAELERALQRSRALEAQLGTENGALAERAAELERTVANRDGEIRALQDAAANAERSARESDQRSGTLERLLRDSTQELADLQDGLGTRDGLISGLKLDLRAKQDALDLLEANVHRLNDLGAQLESLEGGLSSTKIVSANLQPLPDRATTNLDGETADDGTPLEPNSHVPSTGRMIIAIDGAEARRYRLREGHMTIGRSVDSDIRIASPFISRFHARISLRDEEALIEDLGSKNGILVNSKLVERTVALHDGDVISLGGQLELKYVDLDRRKGAPAPR
jgi:predicted  nucleic acid-binding Zn-ribbon protein